MKCLAFLSKEQKSEMGRLQNAVGIYGHYTLPDPVQHARTIGRLASTSRKIKNELGTRGMTRDARSVVRENVVQKAKLWLDKLMADLEILIENVDMMAPPGGDAEDLGSEHMPGLQAIGSDINRLVMLGANSTFPKATKTHLQNAQTTYFKIFQDLYDGQSVYADDIMQQLRNIHNMVGRASDELQNA